MKVRTIGRWADTYCTANFSLGSLLGLRNGGRYLSRRRPCESCNSTEARRRQLLYSASFSSPSRTARSTSPCDREVADSAGPGLAAARPLRFNGAATARSRIDLRQFVSKRLLFASMGPRPRGRG